MQSPAFTGNLKRIKESIVLAKEQGATLRVGPELEVTVSQLRGTNSERLLILPLRATAAWITSWRVGFIALFCHMPRLKWLDDVYLHSFQMLRAILEDRTLDGTVITAIIRRRS